MPRLDQILRGALSVILLSISFSALAAQATGSGGAAGVGGLRAYWHVFIAYAVVLVLVLGWVISIGRRLKDVEQRLGE
jgi:CcmD family protein